MFRNISSFNLKSPARTPGPLDVGSSTRSESFSFDQQDFDHNILELPETRGSAELRRDITAKINPESLQDLIRESQNLDDEAKLHNETETVGDIVNGYCRRYSVTTESIYSLILSSSGIDKESQAGIRKTTEWNAYQTLYKDELKEKCEYSVKIHIYVQLKLRTVKADSA